MDKLAYVAGLFNGEGSIFILKANQTYFLCSSITNTNLPVLTELKELIGGQLSEYPQTRKRRAFKLRLESKVAKAFLEKVLPYLRIKREQAKLAIKFQSRKVNGKRTMTIEEQERYRTRISALNFQK